MSANKLLDYDHYDQAVEQASLQISEGRITQERVTERERGGSEKFYVTFRVRHN